MSADVVDPAAWSCPRCSRVVEDDPDSGVVYRLCAGDPRTGQLHPPTAMTRPAPPPTPPAPPKPTPTPGQPWFGCRWCGGPRRLAGFLGRYLVCPTCDLTTTQKEPSR